MRKVVLVLIVLVVCFNIFATVTTTSNTKINGIHAISITATGQEPFSTTAPKDLGRPSVAVVLSGGGAKGLAHIALLEELEKRGIPIDMVMGTSMGSLIAGLYCAGYSSGDIERLVTENDLNNLFTDILDSGTKPLIEPFAHTRYNILSLAIGDSGIGESSGIISDRKILAFFEEILANVPKDISFDELPTPYRAIATDVLSGDLVLFEGGSLIDAMRSSMSIPLVFDAYEVEGLYLMDGGLVDNMPIKYARELGYDIVIGMDMNGSEKIDANDMHSMTGAANAAFRVIVINTIRNQYEYANIVLVPEVSDIGVLSFGEPQLVIQRGWDEIEAHSSALDEITAMFKEEDLEPKDPHRVGQYFTTSISNANTANNDADIADGVSDKFSFASNSADGATDNSTSADGVSDDSTGSFANYFATDQIDGATGNSSFANNSANGVTDNSTNDDTYDSLTQVVNAVYKTQSANEGALSKSRLNLGVSSASEISTVFNGSSPVMLQYLPTIDSNFFKKDILNTEWDLMVSASLGDNLKLGALLYYPLDSTQDDAKFYFNPSLYFVFGAITPLANRANPQLENSMDFASDLNFAIKYTDAKRFNSNLGLSLRFTALGRTITGIPASFSVMPVLYINGIWYGNFEDSMFSTTGIRVDAKVSFGYYQNTFTYLFGVSYEQNIVLTSSLTLGLDALAFTSREPLELMDSYTGFGGWNALVGCSNSLYVRDAILLGTKIQWGLGGFLPSYLVFEIRTGWRSADTAFSIATASSSTGVAPENKLTAPFSELRKFNLGFGVGYGIKTPICDFLVGFGISIKGDFALYFECY